MAERLESYDFSNNKAVYPWSEWSDGSVWRLIRGEDYTISTANMRAQVHSKSKSLGLKARTDIIGWSEAPTPERATDRYKGPRPASTEVLVIQFYNPEEGDREFESAQECLDHFFPHPDKPKEVTDEELHSEARDTGA